MRSFSPESAGTEFFSLLLVTLVLMQPLALPLHEYNLRQDGFKLVYASSFSASKADESTQVHTQRTDYYNVALCGTHYLIQTLQQFPQLFVAALMGFGILLSRARRVFCSSLVRKDEFLTERILRAPPLSPAQPL